MRLQQRFPLGGRMAIDGMVEVFNVFNHANYGSYTTQESNASYGQPSYNSEHRLRAAHAAARLPVRLLIVQPLVSIMDYDTLKLH